MILRMLRFFGVSLFRAGMGTKTMSVVDAADGFADSVFASYIYWLCHGCSHFRSDYMMIMMVGGLRVVFLCKSVFSVGIQSLGEGATR